MKGKHLCRFAISLGLVGLFALVLHSSAWAGTTGKIAGTVTDADTKEPLPLVNVLLEGTTLGTSTDVDGRYFILNVPPGEYSLAASMVGYIKSTKTEVKVSADLTTTVNFALKATVIEAPEVVVTAERPLIEPDLAASQTVVTPEETEALPANQILEALIFEPGVELENLTELRIRGGTPDEVSFQVDGLERTDPLNNKAYTMLNSAMIKEIQLLTGGFNAEYGNLRSGFLNVIEREGAGRWTYSLDYRYVPAAKKHFGPGAYDQDQYDYLLYGRPDGVYDGKGIFFDKDGNATYNPYEEVWDKPLVAGGDTIRAEGDKAIWVGWRTRAEQANADNWQGKNDWTPEQLQEVWRWRHKGHPYGEDPDQYVDAGFGGPLPLLSNLGLKNASFYAGYKLNKVYLPVAALIPAAEDQSYELKFTTYPSPSVKLTLSGLYGTFETTAQGNQWGSGIAGVGIHGGDVDEFRTIGSLLGWYRGNNEWGGNRYNLSYHVKLEQVYKQGGLKMTHTLNPSTFYELRYNWFRQEQEAGRDDPRFEWDPATGDYTGAPTVPVKTINGVDFPAIEKWVESTKGGRDLTGAYELGGGGMVRDTSYAVMHRVNLDLSSQVNPRHLVKAGAELELSHLVKDYERINETIWMYGHFYTYDVKPRRFAAYVQDKIEYGGMIANVGLRVEHFKPGGAIYFPDDPYSIAWARRQSLVDNLRARYPDIEFPDYPPPDVPKEETGQWLKEHRKEVQKDLLSRLPQREGESHTVWSPRVGISHPIGEHTKFFFSYGQFYSTPKSQFRYGIGPETDMFGGPGSNTRDIGWPDLRPPKTSAYEVGFEQSLRDEYLIRLRGYAKDETDQIAGVTYLGMAGSDMNGEPGPSVGLDVVARYNTFRNNNYEDIRGIEAKVMKLRGRWLTGWLTFDYRIGSSGNQGFDFVPQSPLQELTRYAAFQSQPEPVPSFLGNAAFHTPEDWGPLWGGFRLSLMQRWSRGAKYRWNPESLPLRELEDKFPENILRFRDFYNTDLRLTRGINLLGQRVSLYLDIKNLFNQKYLNTGAINDWTAYIEDVVIENDTKIGAKDTFKYLNEPWTTVDKNTGKTVWHKALGPNNDWFQFLNPRSFLIGIRIEG